MKADRFREPGTLAITHPEICTPRTITISVKVFYTPYFEVSNLEPLPTHECRIASQKWCILHFKIWLVWLIIDGILKSPGIKFPIPQESSLVPKVIGVALLIKVLGLPLWEQWLSTFLPDIWLLHAATPVTLGMRATLAAQIPSWTGHFKMCCVQGKKEGGKISSTSVSEYLSWIKKKRTSVLLSFLCRLRNWISHY